MPESDLIPLPTAEPAESEVDAAVRDLEEGNRVNCAARVAEAQRLTEEAHALKAARSLTIHLP